MDITYINSKNIKISVSQRELCEHGLDAESLDYSKTRTKRFIWELLDTAYIQTGFDADGSRIIVRIFPSGDGGCELFVTKTVLGKSGDNGGGECDGDDCGAESSESIAKKSCGFICTVPDAEKLFMLCSRLRTAGFRGESSLFCGKDGSFALLCRNENRLPSYISKSAAIRAKDYSFAAEYGEFFPAAEIRIAYLAEHFDIICENGAVEKLCKK